MILNDRKIRILEAIITDYIETAEPIGSRTIAKKYDLGVSSATIRNEMSDLEELGFIIQPHTSAGRVPSDKGYRLYVDRLMHFRELTNQEMEFLKNTILNNINQIDYLMQQTAKALALLTNYTTIVSEPKASVVKIKHVQLIPFDENSIIAVIITEDKMVNNYAIKTKNPPEAEVLNSLSRFLNESLKKYSVKELKSMFSENDEFSKTEYADIILAVLDTVTEASIVKKDTHIYTSGVNNILDFPEFSDIEKAKSVFKAFEEKEFLMRLIKSDNAECDDSIRILIGKENDLEQLKNCSIIKTDYKFGNDSFGSIGIIGPTRMDYSQVVSVLNGIVKNINEVIKAVTGG